MSDWAQGLLDSFARQQYEMYNPAREAQRTLQQTELARKKLMSQLSLAQKKEGFYQQQAQHDLAKLFSERGIADIREQSQAVMPGTALDLGTFFFGQLLQNYGQNKYGSGNSGSIWNNFNAGPTDWSSGYWGG